ncbi:hydroxymethylglutaryl-CoA lyase [Paraferrimonas sedimenticola]|uniref:Hydroxymethylglutaryl-CoA lyase n=1 Tax=Paraferrimonas sedimenticola TaxID=375674 RepID=A0AA37VWS2_9GAMM|nr:hydroxymethylglutaryl-CoA lyase [Paraferrimonas sedimenticola]GLP96369.1 hydroxymethylglutaryl-CoA lyase [Paraferrimonas sedimenticola]
MAMVTITDVGPRDGLQNQAKHLSVAERVELIQGLVDAGVNSIEAGAFVSPKAVPAMAGADELFAQIQPLQSRCQFQALIPNVRGYQAAVAAGAKKILFVLCANDTMNMKNVRMTRQQSVEQLKELLAMAKADGVKILTCIAVAWRCPFEGKTDPEQVIALAQLLTEMGADDLVIADTIGAANPMEVESLMSRLVKAHGADKIAVHFHDTRAMGLANAYAAYQAGVRRFDASVGGLGGCPFAPGATGNVTTEDLVMMFEQMGVDTGIDLEKLMAVGRRAGELTETQTGGRARDWRELQVSRGQSLR